MHAFAWLFSPLIGARLVADKGDLKTFKSELKRAIHEYLGLKTGKLT